MTLPSAPGTHWSNATLTGNRLSSLGRSVDHTVCKGESMGSIAFEHGFFWETLWVREESKASDAKHQFKRKGVPAQIVLVLRKPSAKSEEKAVAAGSENHWDFDEAKPENLPDEPDANVPYQLFADGLLVKEGKSDGDGKIKATLSPAARNGILILHRGTARERTIELQFRHMDPDAGAVPERSRRAARLARRARMRPSSL